MFMPSAHCFDKVITLGDELKLNSIETVITMMRSCTQQIVNYSTMFFDAQCSMV